MAMKRKTAENNKSLPSALLRCEKVKVIAGLLFVAVEAVGRSEGAKEAVGFVVNAGGEKQSVGQAGGRVITEGK